MWPAYYYLTTTPPALSTPPLKRGFAFYTLIEMMGADPERDAAQFDRVLDLAFDRGLCADAVIARSNEVIERHSG